MTSLDKKANDDGSRDCGRFFLDVVGQFARGEIRVNWLAEDRSHQDGILRQIQQTWETHSRRARRDDVKLFDGPLCRLVAFSSGEDRLELTLAPTSFKEFLGTNLTRADMRYLHGVEALANPLGVSAAVTTADGFILMGRRSRRVAHNAGRIHPVAGMVEPTGRADDPPDPFVAILREVYSETNVSAGQVSEIVCLGLVRDKAIVQPELVFDIELKDEAPTILRRARQAPDADEHDELLCVMNYPSSVVTFLEKNAAALTPVGTAMLLLHGLRHWGSGWFASARGYLRSVV